MADLVLNINFDESCKLQNLVIETYEGHIPHLKSKQYSGPLRNTNINGLTTPDNLSPSDFELIKSYLNNSENIQIDKHRYLLKSSTLPELVNLAQLGCLFYKKRKNPMFQVCLVRICDQLPVDAIPLRGASIRGKKNEIELTVDQHYNEHAFIVGIAKAYVDLKKCDHRLQLIFDYDGRLIKYPFTKEKSSGNEEPRNYALEADAQTSLREANWHYAEDAFVYAGKSFQNDLLSLVDKGIKVYTQEKKPISKGDFSNIHVSYGIDWFEVEGSISVGQNKINVGDLLDLTHRNSQWVEVNGTVLAIPKTLRSTIAEGGHSRDGISLPKYRAGTAIELAHDLNKGVVDGLSKLVDCENARLSINKDIMAVLRPYQITGVKWLLALRKSGFGGCLADDMGLGKTLQAIAYLSDSSMNDSINLIVVPKTLLTNWEREFKKFPSGANVYTYHGANRCVPKNAPKIILTTYGTLLHDIEKLKRMAFTNLIVDEAQFIKNPNAKSHRAISMIQAETKIILTGTPVENNIKEYWGLMRLINPEVFEGVDPFKRGLEGGEAVSRIRNLTSPFLLRRTKREVLIDLPEKRVQTIYCDMGDSQSQLYRLMLRSIQHEIASEGSRFQIKTGSVVLKGLLYLQEICCHPQLLSNELNPMRCNESVKLDLLLELLGELRDAGHKVVVFSRFTRMLRIIERKLTKSHFPYYYLDGKTENRIEVVDEFEKNEEGVFLISLKAGGTGINLVSADTVILYDPWWNPAIEEQAQDRVFRIGQTKNVMVYKLIVSGTIEEKVQLLQDEKRELYGRLLDGHDLPVPITVDEMLKLLED